MSKEIVCELHNNKHKKNHGCMMCDAEKAKYEEDEKERLFEEENFDTLCSIGQAESVDELKEVLRLMLRNNWEQHRCQ